MGCNSRTKLQCTPAGVSLSPTPQNQPQVHNRNVNNYQSLALPYPHNHSPTRSLAAPDPITVHLCTVYLCNHRLPLHTPASAPRPHPSRLTHRASRLAAELNRSHYLTALPLTPQTCPRAARRRRRRCPGARLRCTNCPPHECDTATCEPPATANGAGSGRERHAVASAPLLKKLTRRTRTNSRGAGATTVTLATHVVRTGASVRSSPARRKPEAPGGTVSAPEENARPTAVLPLPSSVPTSTAGPGIRNVTFATAVRELPPAVTPAVYSRLDPRLVCMAVSAPHFDAGHASPTAGGTPAVDHRTPLRPSRYCVHRRDRGAQIAGPDVCEDGVRHERGVGRHDAVDVERR